MGEVPEDQKTTFRKGKKEDLKNYRMVSLTLICGKLMEQIVLETVSKQMKDKKVVGSGHHGFMKGKLCLTDLIAFHKR